MLHSSFMNRPPVFGSGLPACPLHRSPRKGYRMRKLSKAGLGILGVTALMLTQATPANADHAGESADIVGVGSDTIQYAGNFLADGDYLGNPGFNASGARMVNFDATGDANGKLTAGAGVVLRGGTVPVTRPNGSGGGVTFLNNNDK